MGDESIIQSTEKQWLIEVLANKQPKWPMSCDGDNAVHTAVQNGVGALVFQTISEQKLDCPPEVKAELKKAYFTNLMRNANIEQVWKELKVEMEQLQFSYIPLKGIYLSQYIYTDSTLRAMSDIDVLMKPQEADELYLQLLGKGAVSAEPGYQPYSSTTDHHLPGLTYKGVYIELHRGLFPDDANYNLPVDLIWKQAIRHKHTLGIHPHLNLIYLCLHLYYTVKRGGLRIGWLYDFIIYSQSDEFGQCEGDFMQQLHELNCTEPVLGLLYATEDLFAYHFDFIEHGIKGKTIRSVKKRIIYFLNHQGEGGTDYSYEIALERLKNTKGLAAKLAFVKQRILKRDNNSQSTLKRLGTLSIRMLGMLRQKMISFFRF
ncbi:nucleotidyltransferase family protein [Carboxylicivirga sediminis]|uniref:Nucleotidyltransferase family protein n=1 Tax=Carboxylicivirga sediminis TaxID=2006564 RepID=A0A941IVL4_9BACT|nr:nucleotidyltransferase family protein [Carboxylicivirga sediminis]MBR8535186.1 nucleotidyltransferase family protein [Carboxylicivirga sediminis]